MSIYGPQSEQVISEFNKGREKSKLSEIHYNKIYTHLNSIDNYDRFIMETMSINESFQDYVVYLRMYGYCDSEILEIYEMCKELKNKLKRSK